MTPDEGRRNDAEQIADPRPPEMAEPTAKRDWQPRDIGLLRKTLYMLCNFICTKQLRPGEHLWSIPVDRERDFDFILSDAISELEHLRSPAGRRPPESAAWQPIETAPKDADILVCWDDKRIVARWIDDSIIHGRSVWMIAGGGAVTPTHWMPLPAPPSAESAREAVRQPAAEDKWVCWSCQHENKKPQPPYTAESWRCERCGRDATGRTTVSPTAGHDTRDAS